MIIINVYFFFKNEIVTLEKHSPIKSIVMIEIPLCYPIWTPTFNYGVPECT